MSAGAAPAASRLHGIVAGTKAGQLWSGRPPTLRG